MHSHYLTVPLQLKSNLETRELEGHGSIFGNVDLGDDIVVKGAFRETLKSAQETGDMPGMYWMHDPERPIGAWTEMREDDVGLYVKGMIADTGLGNEVRELMRVGAVRKLSIGYKATDYCYDSKGHRLLKSVNLRDVSPVSIAMNPLAKISAFKSQMSADGEYVPTEREMENHFREMGCSKKTARVLVHRLFDDDDRGGMPDGRRWDAGVVDEDQKAVLAALGASALFS